MTNMTTFAPTKQSVESRTMHNMIDEEKKELILRRGREIKSGQMKLIAHEEVMQEMAQMLCHYEG